MNFGGALSVALALSAVASVGMLGCRTSPVLPGPPPPRALATYRLSRTEAGVSVAVEPLLDRQASNELFGIDLPQLNVIPVYVLVRNDGGGTVRVRKENLHLEIAGGASGQHYGGAPRGPGTASQVARGAAQAVIALTGIVAPVTIPLLIPASAATGLPEARRAEARDRMARYELPEKLLSPGESVFGFAYLRTDRDAFGDAQNRLRMRVPDFPASDSIRDFVFPCDDTRTP